MQVVAIAFATLGTAAATLTLMNDDIPDYAVPAGEWEPGSVLDGRTFHTVDTVVETGEVMEDRLMFRASAFQSVMCQDYCDFGWSEYQTKIKAPVMN